MKREHKRDRGVRIIFDPQHKGSLAHELRAHLSQRSLNAAFRAYAEAMNAAQLLETAIALLVFHLRYERTPNTDPDQLFRLYAPEFQRPLGALMQLLRREIQVPADLEANLANALSLRNFIAHRY